MNRHTWHTVILWGVIAMVPAFALAQTYPCRRVDTGVGYGCGAGSGYLEAHANYESDYANDESDLAESFAGVTKAIAAASDKATATVSTATWSACGTDRGNVTYLPEVSSQADLEIVATITQPGGSAEAIADTGPRASARTRFQVESGAGSDPVLYGSIYFLISGSESGDGLLTYGLTTARCAGSDLSATSMGLDICVTGVLQTASGPVYVGDWYVGDVNAVYNTEEDTNDEDIHQLDVSASHNGYATAYSYSPVARSHWIEYGEVSFVVEER